MTIHETLNELAHSDKPVARALHSGHNFRVLVMAFKQGMIIDEHLAHHPSKLIVIYGNIIYRIDGTEIVLNQFEEVEIPMEVFHSFEATEDSLCLLTQG